MCKNVDVYSVVLSKDTIQSPELWLTATVHCCKYAISPAQARTGPTLCCLVAHSKAVRKVSEGVGGYGQKVFLGGGRAGSVMGR